MALRIGLNLKGKYFELVKIEEKFECATPDNNFIKISYKTLFSDSGENTSFIDKIDDREFTIHPRKTHLKTKTKKCVDLLDGNDPPHWQDRTDIYPDIGYENFLGKFLVIYQCDFANGFANRPFGIEPSQNQESYLSLDIDYDDPFWFGIIFSKLSVYDIQDFLVSKTISEFRIQELRYGSIIIAARTLKPEWETYGIPKEKVLSNQYTNSEVFCLKND